MRTRLLLDTCTVIWIARDEALAPAAEQAITAAYSNGESIGVSPITAWELGLLGRKGRLPGSMSPTALFERFVGVPGVEVQPLTTTVLIDSSYLPGELHRDPCDRIIVATARDLDLTVITRDAAILAYAEQGYVRALAC